MRFFRRRRRVPVGELTLRWANGEEVVTVYAGEDVGEIVANWCWRVGQVHGEFREFVSDNGSAIGPID